MPGKKTWPANSDAAGHDSCFDPVSWWLETGSKGHEGPMERLEAGSAFVPFPERRHAHRRCRPACWKPSMLPAECSRGRPWHPRGVVGTRRTHNRLLARTSCCRKSQPSVAGKRNPFRRVRCVCFRPYPLPADDSVHEIIGHAVSASARGTHDVVSEGAHDSFPFIWSQSTF